MSPSEETLLLAIEIGGTKLQAVVGTPDGRIVARLRESVDRNAGAEGIRHTLRDMIRAIADTARGQGLPAWQAVGVGYGGPVDHRSGTIQRSFHIEGWTGFPLGSWLRELVGVPVFVENDANAAALGEAVLGAGRGADPVFYTNSGSGVGGGLVTGGRLYHGETPGEAEFGHLRMDRAGRTVESLCSGWAVDRKVRAIATSQPDSFLARHLPEQPGGEARLLGPALAAEDAAAIALIHETAADLAFALSHVVHLFHPEVIVLGGGLSMLGEPWREAVAGALPPLIMDGFAPGPAVRLSALAEDVVPLGAICVAAERLFSDATRSMK